MKESATNEQPSAEAFEAAWELHNWMIDCKHPETHERVARLLHSFAQQRVSAETERWKHRDRQRLEQIGRLQETVQSFQSTQVERPAPPQRPEQWPCPRSNVMCSKPPCFFGCVYERPAPNLHWHEGPPYCERPAPKGQGGYVIEVEFDDGDEAQRAYDAIEKLLGEMGQLGTLGMRPLPSATASTGEQPPSPASVVDYTDNAALVEQADTSGLNPDALGRDGSSPSGGTTIPAVVDYTERALQAARDAVESVPSELWIDRRNSGTIAQAIAPDFAEFASAVAAERDAALLGPDVREAVKAAMRERDFARDGEYLPDDCYEAFADAAIAVIAERLK